MACIKPPRNVTERVVALGPTAIPLTTPQYPIVPLSIPVGQQLATESVEANRAYVEALQAAGKTSGIRGVDGPYQYQVSVLNSVTEYNVGLPGGPEVWADGIDVETGLIQDAKFAEKAASMYDPPSMKDDFGRDMAIRDATARLDKYKTVIESSSNPLRGLEIVTTDSASAAFFDGLMNDMGIPGRVRIE